MFLISEFRILSNIQDGDLSTKSNIKLLKLQKKHHVLQGSPKFAKLLVIRTSMVYLQHTKCMPASHFYIPTCQSHNNFSIWAWQKADQFLNYFSKEFFNFSIMLNICTFQEHLGNSRKFILQNKVFKLWHLKNFIKEKPYQPKTFDIVFNGAHRINQTIIQLV